MPAARVSISTPGPILSSTATAAGSGSSSKVSPDDKSPSRRASVATGMLSVPFQKSPKEAQRWRQSHQAQSEGIDSDQKKDRSTTEELVKTVNQRIFEKTAVSLALGMFVILMAFVFGSISRLILGRDLGILAIWINHLVILTLFVFDKRPDELGGGKRMDKFTAFEILTLVCQMFPLLYALKFGEPFSYYGMLMVILLQGALKFVLMNALGEVVDISL
jgi:hypothetical protein